MSVVIDALLGALVILGDPKRLVDDLAGPDPADLARRWPREVDQLADGPLDPLQLPCGQVQLFARVGIRPAPLEDLNERAQGRQRIADFVRDTRGEQAEGRHFLLVDHSSLRGAGRQGPFLDPVFQLFAGRVELAVEVFELFAGGMQRARPATSTPTSPTP